MLFAFLSPYITHPIWDGCQRKFFTIFAGLDRRHAYVSKHIILKTNICEVIQNHHK